MQNTTTSIFPRAEAGNLVFKKLAQSILRFRMVILAAACLLSGGLGYAARGLSVDTSFKAMMVAEPEAVRTLRTLQENFGREDMFVLLVEGDVFSIPYLERLRALHQDLARLNPPLSSLGKADLRDEYGRAHVPSPQKASSRAHDHDDFGDFGEDAGWEDETEGTVVTQIMSLVNVSDTKQSAEGLRVFGFLDEWPTPATLPALRARALARKSIVGNVLGKDCRHSVIYLQTDFTDQDDTVRLYDEIERVAQKHRSDGFSIRITGAPGLGAEVYKLTNRDVRVITALSLFLMAIILLMVFKRPSGVVFPLLVVTQAVLWTVGAMTMAQVPLTLLSAVTPAFLFSVGLGDSIHIQSVTQQKIADGMLRKAAVVYAVEHVGVPVVFTSLTTALGLLSFQFSSLHAIREFGLFGAFGVMASLVLSLAVLPVLLSFGPDTTRAARKAESTSDLLDRMVDGCNVMSAPQRLDDGTRSFRRRNAVLWTSAMFTLVCAGAAMTVRVMHYPLTWLPKDNPARTAVEELDEHVGGAADFTLLIEAKPGTNLKSRDFLLSLEALEQHILAYEDPGGRGHVVRSTFGLLDVVRDTFWALTGQSPRGFRIPDTQRGVSDTFTLLENASPSRLRQVMTVDGHVAVMYARTMWLDDNSFRPLIAHIAKGVDKYTSTYATIRPTGAVYDAVASGDHIIPDLVQSFAFSFATVIALMVLMLADLKLGLLAIFPNLLPILFVMAFMGVASMPLDLSTLVVASVSMGIVVDNTIHFLHHFQTTYKRSGIVEDAINTSFRRAGRAMVETSVVLVAGFLVFLAAELSNIRAFGILIAVAVISALAADLIISPAQLRIFYKNRSILKSATNR